MNEDALARDIIRLVQTRGENEEEMLRGPVALGIAVGAFLSRLDAQPLHIASPIRAAIVSGLCRGALGSQDAQDLLSELATLVTRNEA